MKSNYKPIGDYIQLVDNRNKELKDLPLVGVTVNKKFIPSVANTIGTDMSNYKLIKKNQFTCSLMQVRRDGKIPVALMKDDEAIISQAYPVFEIKDTNELLPEFLMMWMSRSEFDREACFHAVGGVRGSLEWKDFCGMQLPVPSLDKQKEIVKEYHTITDRIKLNEELNQKLEDTAQSIYKEWFVNFEFPDENGKPYKSNGGEMEYCDELDMEIPKGWNLTFLSDFCKIQSGYAFKSTDFSDDESTPIIKIKNITPPVISLSECQYYKNDLNKKMEKYIVNYDDILISMTGSGINQINSAVGQVGRYLKKTLSLLNQRVGKFIIDNEKYKLYIYLFISDGDTHMTLLHGATGSANQANISPEQIENLRLLNPSEILLNKFEKNIRPIINLYDVKSTEIEKLKKLNTILLSKMATIED